MKKKEVKNPKGLHRLYLKGGSTLGLIRGEKIESISQIVVGLWLIIVHHGKQSESLVEVVGCGTKLFHYLAIKPNGKPLVKDGAPSMAIESELLHNGFYKAMRPYDQASEPIVLPKQRKPRLKLAA